jgi:hypothetical protein
MAILDLQKTAVLRPHIATSGVLLGPDDKSALEICFTHDDVIAIKSPAVGLPAPSATSGGESEAGAESEASIALAASVPMSRDPPESMTAIGA